MSVQMLKFVRTSCVQKRLWNPAACTFKDGKYLASITDNSVITCDEIIN